MSPIMMIYLWIFSHQKCYQGRFLIERTASSIFHRETNFQAWDGLRRNVFHLENQNNYWLSDNLNHAGVLFLYLKMTFYPKFTRCFGWLFVLKRVFMHSKFYTVYCVHKILRHFTSANLFQLNHMQDQWCKVLVNRKIQFKIKVIIKPWLILDLAYAFIFYSTQVVINNYLFINIWLMLAIRPAQKF